MTGWRICGSSAPSSKHPHRSAKVGISPSWLKTSCSPFADPFADLSDDEVQRRLKDAQTAFLDARAGHQLWNCIVADVVQADPLLKAVHTGPNAGPMERALHPLVDQRDILSLASANLAAGVSATANALTAARTQNMVAMRQNRELAARVLALAAKTKTGGAESIEDLEVRVRLQELKDETRASRRQYRIIKSVVGAVVAASGVDWAEDEELRELVLDDEEL